MRIVAELPHPDCKITIFSMNGKFIIKLEKGAFEQVYKLSEIDFPEGANDVFRMLDEEFMKTAALRFNQMRIDFNSAYKRHET